MVGIGIAIIVGVGYLYSRRVSPAPPPVVAVAEKDSEPVSDTAIGTPVVNTPAPSSSIADTVAYRNELARTPTPAVAKPVATPPAPTVKAPVVAATPVDPAMVPPKPSAPPKVAVPDSGAWEFAVATTWVRVRSAPTRDSEVLRMVDSAQKVRLGPPMNGWRPVRVGVDRGWVDPRLFTIVPGGKP